MGAQRRQPSRRGEGAGGGGESESDPAECTRACAWDSSAVNSFNAFK